MTKKQIWQEKRNDCEILLSSERRGQTHTNRTKPTLISISKNVSFTTLSRNVRSVGGGCVLCAPSLDPPLTLSNTELLQQIAAQTSKAIFNLSTFCGFCTYGIQIILPSEMLTQSCIRQINLFRRGMLKLNSLRCYIYPSFSSQLLCSQSTLSHGALASSAVAWKCLVVIRYGRGCCADLNV